MNKKFTLGVIGGGNMAGAIIGGITRAGILKGDNIIVGDIDSQKLNDLHTEYGIAITFHNKELIDSSDYILLAVKPQVFPLLRKDFNGSCDINIISIMAGVNIDKIKSVTNCRAVCRVMPNTPAMIGKGISALCFEGYSDLEKNFVRSIFESIGEAIYLNEGLFHAVTSISGSGPAYVYTFINAMIKGGVEGGLSESDSRKLAIATTIGAAEMALRNPDKSIDELINAVCSKGGTTIEAIKSFKRDNLEDIIIKGIKACRLRSEELSREES